MRRFFLEHRDELVADALPLDLGILDAGQPFIEPLARIDRDDMDAEAFTEPGDDLQRLVLSQHAVVDEDRSQLIADRFRNEQRCD